MAFYGNTLTDLQSGMNAGAGIANQRKNAQDALAQAQLESFLRYRGDQERTKAAQENANINQMMTLAQLGQQNQQFGTRENNMMKIAEMEAKSRMDVANATKGGLDPRAFESILVYNQQGLDKVASAKALSARRKALVDEIRAYEDRHFYGNGPLSSAFKSTYGREPDATKASAELNALDLQAATNFGLSPNRATDGYDIPFFEPINPTGLRGTGTSPATPVLPQAQSPSMLPGAGAGEVTIGGEPLMGGSPLFPGITPSLPAAPAPNRRIVVGADGRVSYAE